MLTLTVARTLLHSVRRINLQPTLYRSMTVRAKRGGKDDEAPAPVVGGTYCLSCGRLLPSPTSNQTESTTPRKYCSASCRSRAKDPSLRNYHTQLARAFHDQLINGHTERQGILCSEIEKAVEPPAGKQDGREEARRTARRLVNFGFKSQGIEEDRSVEAVQDGKVVETSFAKGEWGIRWQSR